MRKLQSSRTRATLSRRRRLAVARLAACLLVPAAAGLLVPSVASASATGCTGFGQHTVDGHTFPSGYMCGHIQGSGTYVDFIGGNFQVAGDICNYRIVGYFYNDAGGYVGAVATGTYNSCTWNIDNPIDAGVYAYLPPGRVVIALQSAGITVASITEYIL